jgi:hypothetical protein
LLSKPQLMPILTLADIAKKTAHVFRGIGEAIPTEPHPTTIPQRATPTLIQGRKEPRRTQAVATTGIKPLKGKLPNENSPFTSFTFASRIEFLLTEVIMYRDIEALLGCIGLVSMVILIVKGLIEIAI